MYNGAKSKLRRGLCCLIDVSFLGLSSSLFGQSSRPLTCGVGQQPLRKSHTPLPQYPSIFRHSCTLQTRHMFLLQKPYFSSPIIHVLCWEYTWIPLIGRMQVQTALSRMRVVWLGVEQQIAHHLWPTGVSMWLHVRTLLLTDYCIRSSHLYAAAVLHSTFQCSSIY